MRTCGRYDAAMLIRSSLVASLALCAFASTAAADYQSAWNRQSHWCGTHQAPNVVSSDQGPALWLAPVRTIWLNRAGGTFRRAANTNSADNTISSDIFGRDMVIPPMSNSFNWNTLVTCVRAAYKPYNVTITETKPSAGSYIQAVVGGNGSEVGRGQGLLGIASADNFCGVTEKGIAFSFSEAHLDAGRRDEELCATVAHEIGHLVGLEHETLPTDIMSYVPISTSRTKAFVNQDSTCGTTPQEPNPCTCTSAAMTNSVVTLKRLLGDRPIETTLPEVTLVAPKDKASLGPSFDVVANATDASGIESVSVLVNDFEFGRALTGEGNKFTIKVKGVSDGTHTLVVEAMDKAGNVKRTNPITVTVRRAATGGDCTENGDCMGNVCASDGTDKFCTQNCDLANDTCPSGFACTQAGASAVCYFDGTSSGGCGCNTKSTGLPGSLLFGLGALLLVGRKRRNARA